MAKKTMDDMVLVSVDDHLIEPPNLYKDHFPERLKSRAPFMEKRGGKDRWIVEGADIGAIGLNAVVGRPIEERGMEPISHAQMRAGCIDIHKRIEDMNVNGVLGSINFPTLGGFAGGLFSQLQDKEVGLACIQAYNDWHVHEWAGPYPGRMIPLGMLPLWDPNVCAEEAKRLAKMGVHAVTFPDNPSKAGFASIHDEAWDPFWKVCADNKIVICCHIGTGTPVAHASPESPIESWIVTMPMAISQAASDWLYAPMWQKFPDLKMALSEGGIGWIPYFLERAAYAHSQHYAWTNFSFGEKKTPRDVFNKHMMTCFIDDEFGLRNLKDVGEDMVTWECDYPHSDTTWPNSPELLWDSIKHLTDEQIDKVTHLNAMREYSFDPFSILGKENCTVGALRAQAKHVDTRPIPNLGGERPVAEGDKRIVRSRDLQSMFARTD